MKRTKLLLLVMLFMMLFTVGCTKKVTPAVEDNTWLMSSVQSIEDNGKIIACSESLKDVFEDAVYMELVCMADNGALTIKDKTNNKTYSGTYKLAHSTYESTSYEITLNGSLGNAVVSYTVYENNRQLTLIISIEDYAITFIRQ